MLLQHQQCCNLQKHPRCSSAVVHRILGSLGAESIHSRIGAKPTWNRMGIQLQEQEIPARDIIQFDQSRRVPGISSPENRFTYVVINHTLQVLISHSCKHVKDYT